MTTSPVVRLSEHGELVASLPFLLGHHPADSLVVAAFGGAGRRIGPVLRADLAPVGQVEALAGEMVAMLPGEYRHHAVLVAVSTEPRSDALADASLVLTAAGIRVTASVWAAGTRAGCRWRCCDVGCGAEGLVPEPHPELAARAAWAGKPTLPSRDAIDQALHPGDPAVLARRARLLSETTGRGEPARRALPALVDDYLARHALDDDLVVALTAALSDQQAVVRYLLSEDTASMRAVLEALVRETPAPWQALPAAYLGLAALLHGDGAHAAAAATRATRAAPDAVLPALVARLVAQNPSPERVRDLVTRF